MTFAYSDAFCQDDSLTDRELGVVVLRSFGSCIPRELIETSNWLTFRRTDKVPFTHDGGFADPTDEEHWCSFSKAVAAAFVTGRGTGLAISRDLEVICIDLDDPGKTKEGKEPLPADVVAQMRTGMLNLVRRFIELGAYVERSPSGTGFHIWFRGTLPDARSAVVWRDRFIEIYGDLHFMTMTGDVVDGCAIGSPLPNCQEFLDKMLLDIAAANGGELPGAPAWKRNAEVISSTVYPVYGRLENLTDEQLVAKAVDRNKRFVDLINGIGQGGRSGVCRKIAGDLDKLTANPEQIERILWQSKAITAEGKDAYDYPVFLRKLYNEWLPEVRYENDVFFSHVEFGKHLFQSLEWVGNSSVLSFNGVNVKINAGPPDGEWTKEFIDEILRHILALDGREQRSSTKLLSSVCGDDLTGLRARLKELKSENADAESAGHGRIVNDVLVKHGAEKIIGAGPSTYVYADTGVWKRIEDVSVRQLVQNYFEANNLPIVNSLVGAVTEVLQTKIHKSDHEFNVGNKEAVCVTNGTLVYDKKLKVWNLHPHRLEDYRTTQLPVAYDPNARAPRFIKFLEEIFAYDEDQIEKRMAILEIMGYSMMAHCKFEKFALLIGEGANGKSVIFHVLTQLLGRNNVAGVQPSQFDNRFQRAHLQDKLANVITELRQGETIPDAELKGITSGEMTTVEHKKETPFEISPFSTCIFGTNHMPHTRDFSPAFFRRALVITFTRVFTQGVDADENLRDYLVDNELPGILNLCLWAYGQAVSRGSITNPKSSREAIQEWRVEVDTVAQFIKSNCIETGREEDTVPTTNFYTAYLDWCKVVNIRNSVAHKQFGQRVEKLGFHRGRNSAARFYKGLRFIRPDEQ